MKIASRRCPAAASASGPSRCRVAISERACDSGRPPSSSSSSQLPSGIVYSAAMESISSSLIRRILTRRAFGRYAQMAKRTRPGGYEAASAGVRRACAKVTSAPACSSYSFNRTARRPSHSDSVGTDANTGLESCARLRW